jgi:hypothetical protein
MRYGAWAHQSAVECLSCRMTRRWEASGERLGEVGWERHVRGWDAESGVKSGECASLWPEGGVRDNLLIGVKDCNTVLRMCGGNHAWCWKWERVLARHFIGGWKYWKIWMEFGIVWLSFCCEV